jgi:hypothetical protein
MSTVKISKDFFKVPKLLADISNWIKHWDQLQWALNTCGILPHLLGTTTIPEPVVTTPDNGHESPSSMTAEPTRTIDGWALVIFFNEKEYQTGQAQVKQVIASTVLTSIFNKLKGHALVSNVWDALVVHHQERSGMISIDLRRKFQELQWGNNDNVHTHLEKLELMGVIITENHYGYTIISSLPSLYNLLISAMLMTSALNALSPNTVINIITDKYDQCIMKSHTKTKKDEKHLAFYADASKGGGKGRSKKDVECFNCHKKGHMKLDCWAQGRGKEGNGWRGKGKATEKGNVAKEEEEDEVWAVFDDQDIASDSKGLVLTDLEGDLDWDSAIPDLEYDDVDQELVPDTPEFDGQHMRDIVLGHYCSPHAFVYCHEDNIDHDSMPDLLTTSKSLNDGEGEENCI